MSAPSEKIDRRIGWALFFGAFLLLLFTEQPVGFTRDESVYFSAGEHYARWFQQLVHEPRQALTDASTSAAFDENHEHPVLMKSLFGLSLVLFNETFHLLRPAAAMRVPAFLIAALMLPLIFAFTRQLFGRHAGIFAALSFLAVPRQFFHAHLACFDVPIATMWMLTVFCFWQAMHRPRWWIYTGLAFGLALATKHNAYFIPVALIPFALARGWQVSKEKPEARRTFIHINAVFVGAAVLYGINVAALGLERFQQTFLALSPQFGIFLTAVIAGGFLLRKLAKQDTETFRAIAPLVAMVALGPAVFYLHWPYLWFHPVDRTAWYLAFHATHNHYTWYYLGQLLREPPFPLDYVVNVTALTVPTSIFVPMVLGFTWLVIRVVRRQFHWLELLVGVNSVVSIALISLPSVPHFGGVKHWFPSMPFLAVLAGGVIHRAGTAMSERFKKLPAPHAIRALGMLVLLPAAIATARVYEFGTSAYSDLAGGLPGAASLGMQRQYWSNNVTGVLPWLNANLRPGERVYFHEVHGGQIHDMQRNGMLRTDIGFAGGTQDADVVVYQYHQEFREHEFNAWDGVRTWKPVTGLYLDETPQIVVYRKAHP